MENSKRPRSGAFAAGLALAAAKPSVIHFIHEEALAVHGGSSDIRDMGVKESALSQPVVNL